MKRTYRITYRENQVRFFELLKKEAHNHCEEWRDHPRWWVMQVWREFVVAFPSLIRGH